MASFDFLHSTYLVCYTAIDINPEVDETTADPNHVLLPDVNKHLC